MKKKICGDTHIQKTSDGTVAWISALTNCANEARWINDSICNIDNNISTALKQVLLIEKKISAYLKCRRDRDRYLQR